MTIESVREHCLSLVHVTEHVQWGEHLVFKVAGKIFCILALEPDENVISFKCTPESFLELQEIEGIVPAPYLARAKWVAMERFGLLRDAELRELLTVAHREVMKKLPKKKQQELHSLVTKGAKGLSTPR